MSEIEGSEETTRAIEEGFANGEYPGDTFLLGSFEGCEPEEEVAFFRGKSDWRSLAPSDLDAYSVALSFLLEAGFRFFLPAYLIADVRNQLQIADPVFHLTSGFHVTSVNVPLHDRVFVHKTGGDTLLNPRRYGAMTFEDYARFRLSVFTMGEAKAIVAYLKFCMARDAHGVQEPAIEAALDSFWLFRVREAPAGEDLKEHLRRDEAFMAGLSDKLI